MNLSQLLRPTAWRLHCATGGRVPVDDLMQEGLIGAFLALLKPEADQRRAFIAARSAMIDALRRETDSRAHAHADEMPAEMAGPDCTEADVMRREQARIVHEEIERLPAIQRAVMADFLGDVPQHETARRLKVCQSRVAQILDSATKALARSVALRTADAARLRAGVPVPPMTAGLPIDALFDRSIVRGVTPALIL